MNEKWFAPDVSQIEKKLKTNAASGLSPRAARSRRLGYGAGFFITPKKSLPSLVIEMLSDFSLVLLLIASFVALCFSEYALGAVALVTLIVNLLVTTFFYYRSQRLFESVENYFHPSVTVIRGGKAYCVDSESVVVGDVVLLTAGDVLSFDARLITSDKLSVLVRVDRNTVEECPKYAEAHVGDVEYDIRNIQNMVHAGSVIKEGSARAIVTAVGRYTYYGAMTGGVVLSVRGETPKALKMLKKYASGFSFALMVAILPFSLLCLLFSHDKVTLLTAFTSVLAIASSSLSGISLTACRVFFEKRARECLDFEHPAVLRSEGVMDKLCEIDYLFLLDGAIASDGVLHFERAISFDGEFSRDGAVTPSAKTLGELASLYDSAENRTLTVGIHTPGRYSRSLGEFVLASGVDAEALKIRCTVTGYIPGNITDNTDKLFYIDGDIRYILSVSSHISSIESCNRIVRGSDIVALSDNARGELLERCAEYINKGRQLLVFTLSDNVAAEADVKLIFAGVLVLSQKSDASFKSSLEALAAKGVKTVSFVNTLAGGTEARNSVASPMLSGGVKYCDFEKAGQPITYKFGKISTYIDISDTDIGALIAYAHSKNKKVAVVSFSDRYRELNEKPDLLISTSALQYRFVGRFEEEIEALEVAGSAESLSCRQDIKSDADVIVPRPSEKKGGLSSLLSAFLSVDSAYKSLYGFFVYVLCAQFARIAMVLLPMFFGAAHLDARHALFCGALIDVFVLFIFCTSVYRSEHGGVKARIERELEAPIRNNAGKIAASVAGAVSALILPRILGMIGVFGRYLYETEYLFISMLLIHLAIAYFAVPKITKSATKRKKRRIFDNVAALALVAFVGVFALLALLIRPFGALFDMIDITLPYLLLTLLPPVLTAVLMLIIGKLRIDK